MVAMGGCDFRGEEFLSSTPLSVPVWIVDSTAMRLTNYLEGRPAPRLSNNLPSSDMLKGWPSSSASKSGLLWHYKALTLRRLGTKPAR